jgi:hypothetical protein
MVKHHQLRPTAWGTAWFECDQCGAVMKESDVLQTAVPRPKGGDPAVVSQCPECGECECFTSVCDEPGCGAEVTCGWPTPAGYRRTCGEHMHK